MFCSIVTCEGIFVFFIITHYRQHKKEQIRNVKACANGSNNAKHAWLFGHRIDFCHSRVIDKGSFCFEKFWRLGIPLLPCMSIITIGRSLISIAFFSNISHLSILLLSCHFYLAFFVYISLIYISCFIRGRL